MASHTVADGKRAKHATALTAATVDTVTFTDDIDEVEIVTDGTAAVYVTVDGSAPTVGGDNTYVMPAAGQAVVRELPMPGAGKAVKLISAATPTYWVTKLR